MNMPPQNIHDSPDFFAGYRQLRESGSGLNDVLEQPALFAMLPPVLTFLEVLDIGCGFGDFARKARKLGASKVTGIDISQTMLTVAAEKTNDTHVKYIHMGIEEMDFPGEQFDIAVSSLALHYVEDYGAALHHIAKALRPGGKLVFSVEHPVCTALEGQRWMPDQNGKPLYWPLDEYRSEGIRHTHWFVKDVVKYHRTVETYVGGLLGTGFILDGLSEPAPTAEALQTNPILQLHHRRPPFLLLSAHKRERSDS